jgi:hypothetical protein
MWSVGLPKNREAPALCGWQDFFGLIFPCLPAGRFAYFLCIKPTKVRIENGTFNSFLPTFIK